MGFGPALACGIQSNPDLPHVRDYDSEWLNDPSPTGPAPFVKPERRPSARRLEGRPADAFSSEGFKLEDEAYDTLVRVALLRLAAKLMFVTSLGFALLFKGFMAARSSSRSASCRGLYRTKSRSSPASPDPRRSPSWRPSRRSVGLRVGV